LHLLLAFRLARIVALARAATRADHALARSFRATCGQSSNEKKISDGYRKRAPIEVEVY